MLWQLKQLFLSECESTVPGSERAIEIHLVDPLGATRSGAVPEPDLSALFQTATLTETGLIAEDAVLWSLSLSCEKLRRTDSRKVHQYYLTVRVVCALA